MTHVSLENNLVTVLSKRSLVKCTHLWDARQTAGKENTDFIIRQRKYWFPHSRRNSSLCILEKSVFWWCLVTFLPPEIREPQVPGTVSQVGKGRAANQGISWTGCKSFNAVLPLRGCLPWLVAVSVCLQLLCFPWFSSLASVLVLVSKTLLKIFWFQYILFGVVLLQKCIF